VAGSGIGRLMFVYDPDFNEVEIFSGTLTGRAFGPFGELVRKRTRPRRFARST